MQETNQSLMKKKTTKENIRMMKSYDGKVELSENSKNIKKKSKNV